MKKIGMAVGTLVYSVLLWFAILFTGVVWAASFITDQIKRCIRE